MAPESPWASSLLHALVKASQRGQTSAFIHHTVLETNDPGLCLLGYPRSSPDPLPRAADGAHAVCVSGALSHTGHLASLVHPPDADALILRTVGVEER